LPFSPLKFSGPMDRVLAFEIRLRFPRLKSNPLNGASAAAATEQTPAAAHVTSSKRNLFFIV
jgi:hypothetical protein